MEKPILTQEGRTVEAKTDMLTALDATLMNTIHRRIALAKEIGKARLAAGGPRTVYSDELAFVNSFRSLGPSGSELGVILLRLSRADGA